MTCCTDVIKGNDQMGVAMVESEVHVSTPSSCNPLKNWYALRSRILALSTRPRRISSLFSKKAESPVKMLRQCVHDQDASPVTYTTKMLPWFDRMLLIVR